MKMVQGIFFILLFYFVGQAISYLIDGFVPGNIIGMILLFLSLHFKAVDPERVGSVANAMTKNMAIFFIPAGAGLIASYDLISKFWATLLVVSSVTTVLVVIVVALIQQKADGSASK